MRHYRATNKNTNEVIEYDSVLPQPEHLGVDWRLEDVMVGEPSPDPTPPPPYDGTWKISKLAFRNRFTAAEKARLEIAALHNPTLALDHPSNLLAASLRASMADQRDAQFIDLRRDETRGGVEVLEQYGLISIGRADAILNTPPTEQEVLIGQ